MFRSSLSSAVVQIFIRAGTLAAILCLFTTQAKAQVLSKLVGPQMSCLDEIGQFRLSFRVVHNFHNTENEPLRVKIGTSLLENFYLFASNTTVDPAAAIFSMNPDLVSTSPTRTRVVNRNESLTWTTTATIIVAGPSGVPTGLPKTGLYYLRPLPDFQIFGRNMPDDDQLIPIRIAKPSGKIPRCKQ
jgi:hypothetical protein